MDEQQVLPAFEGEQPRLTELALTGGSKRRTRPYRLHERITLVIEVEVTAVEHVETKGGLARKHKVAMVDVYELGGDRAPDLIATLADEYETAFGGMSRLPFGADPQVGEIREVDGVDHEWAEVDSGDDGETVFDWVPVEPDDDGAPDTNEDDGEVEPSADGADT